MPEIYRTSSVGAQPEAQGSVLVLHCSDPRYQPHFQDFVRRGLGVNHYALLAVPGGSQFLTLVDYLPKFSWAGWRWVKFLTDLTRCERLIVIGHEDCRWYLLQGLERDPARLRERVCADLRRVRESIVERFPQIRVELYFATLEGDRASFESL